MFSATRQNYTRKAERDRFDREVRTMLVEEFDAVEQTSGFYQYSVWTSAGPLGVNVYVEKNSPGCVMTRFKNAQAGKELCGAAVPSGKWNHHFSPGTTCETALDHIRGCFETVTFVQDKE